MNYKLMNYRYAEEIIQHKNYEQAWNEITTIVCDTPLFIYPHKSGKNMHLDVVQQLINTYYDRILSVENSWEYHPLATKINNSRLAADFRKDFNGLRIQVEVQFGNMARFYSDIFKFQTAYSQDLIDMGLCIVPTSKLGSRIDSNVTNYERIQRELPSAKMSITIPILIIGIYPDENTKVIDVSKTKFTKISDITGKGKVENRYRIINGYLTNKDMSKISNISEIGKMATSTNDIENDDLNY